MYNVGALGGGGGEIIDMFPRNTNMIFPINGDDGYR